MPTPSNEKRKTGVLCDACKELVDTGKLTKTLRKVVKSCLNFTEGAYCPLCVVRECVYQNKEDFYRHCIEMRDRHLEQLSMGSGGQSFNTNGLPTPKDEPIVALLNILMEHNGSCAFIQKKCPNEGCDQFIQRRYFSEHVENCPFLVEDNPAPQEVQRPLVDCLTDPAMPEDLQGWNET